MSGVIGHGTSGVVGHLAPGTTVLLFSGAQTADHSSVNDGGLIGSDMTTGATIRPLPGNDIMIYFSVSLSGAGGVRYWAHIRKNGSDLTGSIGNASGNRRRTTVSGTGSNSNATDTHGGFMYVDVNPYTGSALTYDILVQPEPNNQVRMNRSQTDSNSGAVPRTASCIQVFEIHR